MFNILSTSNHGLSTYDQFKKQVKWKPVITDLSYILGFSSEVFAMCTLKAVDVQLLSIFEHEKKNTACC